MSSSLPIPRQLGEQQSHAAKIRDAGKHQTRAAECSQAEKAMMDKPPDHHADQYRRSSVDPHLAFEAAFAIKPRSLGTMTRAGTVRNKITLLTNNPLGLSFLKMRVSKRTDYALRALFTLVDHYGGSPIPIRELARRNDAPKRFLEQIMLALKAQGWVDSTAGIRGGYFLARNPAKITMGEVIAALAAGRLVEMFGSGTAAVVSQVGGLHYGGQMMQLPTPADGLAVRVLAAMNDIYYGRVAHSWAVDVEDWNIDINQVINCQQ